MQIMLKKSITCSLIAPLLLAVLLCKAQATETTTGEVKTLSGTVQVQRGETPLKPAVGDILQRQDSIRTGADGSIGISFVDGTRLSLGPSSDVALRDYVFEPLAGTYAFNIHVLKGSAAYVSGKLGKLAPESVKISTPQATIGVRGTSFVLKVN